MIQSYPGLWPDHIESVVLDGVVLVGTGLGHVASRTFPAMEKLQREGKFVVMASQCLHGRVNMNVYSTGRDLQRLGVVPAEDMLPEVAYVKAMWVLAHAKTRDEAVRLFLTPLAGEMEERSEVAAYAKPSLSGPRPA
jgi:glutamyl-tRNA(Gln) amidotransferase subunit D